jgi:hypothetical protein
MVLLVDQAGVAENSDEVVKGIVNVGNGDDGFPRSLRWSRPR